MESSTPDNPRGQVGRPADRPPQASDFMAARELGEPAPVEAAPPKAASSGFMTEDELMGHVTPVMPVAPQAAPSTESALPVATGLREQGTIKDIWDRPILHNADGSISTTLSFSIGTDKGETLIPQVINGKKLTREEAITHFRQTGEHLGVFDTPEHADQYAQALHEAQYAHIKSTPESPGYGEIAGAAFAQSNVAGSALEKYMFGGYKDFTPKPGYDVYANDGSELKGYEEYASNFTRSESPEQTQNIKNLIDAERTDKDTLARAGTAGYIANLASGATDPLTLTLMLLPGFDAAGLSRLAKIGTVVAANVGAGEAQQGALAAMQQTGNYTDGIIPRIGVNALLAGVLGRIATRVPKKELNEAANNVRLVLNNTPKISQDSKSFISDFYDNNSEALKSSGVQMELVRDPFDPNTVHLQNFIAPERGKGLGKPFMESLKEAADDAGITITTRASPIKETMESVITAADHEELAAYYNFHGFESTGSAGEMARAPVEAPPTNASGISTAGAQQVHTTTLDDESIARGGGFIASTLGKVNPVARIFTDSLVPEARRLAQRLVDLGGIMLNKNKKGVATLPSLEMKVNEQANFRNSQLILQRNDAFARYKAGGGTLSGEQFDAEISDAMRNSDAHAVPEVQEVAQWARPMFDTDNARMVKAGLIEDTKGKPPVGAPSYFPRVWDQRAIMKNLSDFTQRLHDWYTANPIKDKNGLPIMDSHPEIRDRVMDTIDRIQGITRGTADIGHDVKNPGVIKLRKLDVPDSILKPYLSSDFEHVMKAYNHSVLPHLEMHEQFGSVTLEDEFKEINDAYHIKKEAATSNETKAKLTEQEAKDVDNLKLLRDRALGQVGPKGNESLNMVRAAQLARSFNYLRTLGAQTLSALPDVGRLVTRYGLGNTSLRLAQYLTGLDSGMMKVTAQKLNTALDVLLHTRMHTLEGIGDGTAGEGATRVMGNLTANFTKITGIAHWDAMMRTLSAQLEQDAMHNLMTKGPTGVSSFERAKLAQHGIGDDEFARIQKQWLQHSSDEYGLHRARTELWTDRGAAQLVENAVQRAGSSNAFFVGKGDLPAFAGSEIGKFILQFKGFAVSSVNRLAIPLAQGLAHGDIKAANGLASMLALGALTYYTKELAFGRQPDLSPHNLMAEAVQRSGVLSYLPDVWDPIAGFTHLPRFSKFQDKNPIETAAGATVGGATALLEAVSRMTKGNINAKDLHKVRQMIPWNNVFYLTRLVNALEGKTADALGAAGAPNKPFADYFNPAQDTPAQEARPDKEHFLGLEQVPNHF